MKKYLEIILGMILVAIAFNLFITPLKIVIGGTNGLSIIVNYLFGINTSMFVALFYVFAFVLNLLFFGIKDTKKLIFGSILYPLLVKIFESIPNYIILDYSNKLLMYLCAAVLIGVGNGLIYREDYIAGGTDVIKKILNKKLKISMGNCVFIIDSIILLSGGFLFGIESILYAIIILYISSKVTDSIILGTSTKKMFYIMTSKPEEVRNYIKNNLGCGITEIDAIGGYSENKYHVLMSVISTRDYIKLKNEINKIDKDVFYVVTDLYYMYYLKGREKYGVN